MRRRELTLAMVGLSAHDERLVRSFLRVLDGRTRASWSLVEGLEADAAICVPGNAMARLANDYEQRSGRPICMAVMDPAEAAGPWNRLLHRPIRIREFQDALDALASEAEQPAAVARQAGAGARSAGTASQGSALAVLRRVREAPETEPRCVIVRVGDIEIVVHLPQAKCYSASGFGPAVLRALAQDESPATVTQCRVGELREEPSATKWVWLETLLWNIGLLGESARQLDVAGPGRQLHLRCWPDFGRIPSDPQYIRLTALLIKQALTAEALGSAAGVAGETVAAFARACACCGILEVSRVEAVPVPAADVPGGMRSLFGLLRSALGMRS